MTVAVEQVDSLVSAQGRKSLVLRIAILMVALLSIIYWAGNLFYDHTIEKAVYFAIGICCAICFVLARRRHELAMAIFFSSIAVIDFLVLSSEPFATGFHLHLLSMGFLAIYLYGYKRRVTGISLVVVFFFIGLLSHANFFSPLQFRPYSDQQTMVFFGINAVLFLSTSPLLLLLIFNWNFQAERKLLANKQKAAEQNLLIRRSNEELDQFVYKTSHDIRAPLNTISGLSNLAQQDPSNLGSYLLLMKEQVDLMEQLIREIIDFSKNVKTEVRKETVDWIPFLQGIIGGLAHTRNFEKVKFEIMPQNLQRLRSDPDRVRVVIRNLLLNSVKYLDEEKALPSVHISSWKERGEVKIRITDNGIGIGTEYQEKIFDMFFKATERSKGSGLGLYMVKETLDKLGGTITLDSAPGSGSSFTISIPEE